MHDKHIYGIGGRHDYTTNNKNNTKQLFLKRESLSSLEEVCPGSPVKAKHGLILR